MRFGKVVIKRLKSSMFPNFDAVVKNLIGIYRQISAEFSLAYKQLRFCLGFHLVSDDGRSTKHGRETLDFAVHCAQFYGVWFDS